MLLQGAALLAHLRLAGRRPDGDWERASVGAEGVLNGVATAPGQPADWPQESLLALASILFGGPPGEIVGRGQARRIGRQLAATWRQELVPLSPDEAIRQLLDAAGFLWGPEFARARGALAGEHLSGGGLWVAGPGRFRRRTLRGVGSWSELLRRLGSPRAVSNWRRRVGRTGDRPEPRARRLLANGRFASAQALLNSTSSPAATALAVSCSVRLGRLESARRRLRRLESKRFDERDLVELADAAVRLHGNLGRPDAALGWVGKALRVKGEATHLRALLTAAASACDRGDRRAVDRYLDQARPALDDPTLACRWRRVAALDALGRGEPAVACRHLAEAVRGSRRSLGRLEAASLWNDLAIARAEADDLAGAERAMLHSVRLHERIEGPRRTTLALFNLAELRLRRGNTRGVREILERSTSSNLESRNWRGLAHDRELGVRYELVRGRPGRALRLADEALEELDRRRLDYRKSALEALRARAAGWLGHGRIARDALSRVTAGEECGLFEVEERPAIWALAGRPRRALEAVGPGPGCVLWHRLLSAGEPSAGDWSELDRLEPYRAARLIADLELVRPGWVPSERVRRATEVLRRAGNRFLVRRLERALEGVWAALGRYFEGSPGDEGELEELFRGAGHETASLNWCRAGGERRLVRGAGGSERLEAPLAGGRLVLRAERIDGVLRALFALVARDWRPSPATGGSTIAGIVGECPPLVAALERAGKLAGREVPVLIVGETGTGKELVARYVHRSSDRRVGPLVPLNSAALSESLILSDLFGHVRGAFTGADRERAGIFETARGGTVFLDELGDLPPQAQGMLLRVLQEGEVRRLGESRVRRVDVRVVAATHRQLDRAVADGTFREDLYYRLAVGRVALPPLRDRGSDIELLTWHFLARHGPERRMAISSGAMERLRRHSWPGNVRELENCLAVAVALAEGDVVRRRHLGLPEAARPLGGYHQRVLEFRRRLVEEALRAVDGNRAAAARRLGMSRQALSYLVRTLGLL